MPPEPHNKCSDYAGCNPELLGIQRTKKTSTDKKTTDASSEMTQMLGLFGKDTKQLYKNVPSEGKQS